MLTRKLRKIQRIKWRKHYKDLYLPRTKPSIIDVPKLKYFTIEGKGNPNSDFFQRDVEKLYSLSYAIKMMQKKIWNQKAIMITQCFHLKGYGI